MNMQNLEITFDIDGVGVCYDKNTPTHLDALIMWAHCERLGYEPPKRDEPPIEIEIPLDKWKIGDTWGWTASALFPDGVIGESLRYMRKRVRMDRVQFSGQTSFNISGGEYMSKNIPIPMTLTKKLVGWARGDLEKVTDLFSDIRYIGRYTSGGVGNVIGCNVCVVDYDYSCIKDGHATRHLPKPDGFRLCRPRPPYWNCHERINVCEVGERV